MAFRLSIAVASLALLLAAGCSHVAHQYTPGEAFPSDGIASPLDRPNLGQSPTRLISYADRIEIAGRVEASRPTVGTYAWTVAAPPGEFKAVEREIVLLDMASGERRSVKGSELDALRSVIAYQKALQVADVGVLRHVRLVAIRIDAETLIELQNRRYTIESFDIAIQFPKWTPQTVHDAAFTDRSRSLRRMLDLSVANIEAIDAYAQAEPEPSADADWSESGWRPRPELSPGLPWQKIPISQTDLYAIDGRWLGEQGLDAASIDPGDVQVVLHGKPVPLVRLGPEGASFAMGARLVFRGVKNDSRETNECMYYLGRRPPGNAAATFADAPSEGEAPEILPTFRRVWRAEEDKLLQTKYGNFLSINSMDWVWRELQDSERLAFPIGIDGLPEPIPDAVGRARLYTSGESIPAGMTLDVSINGTVIESDAKGGDTVAFAVPAHLLRHNQNTIELALKRNDATRRAPKAAIFLDALELEGSSVFKAHEGRLEVDFSRTVGVEGPRTIQAVGFRPGRLLALDITDPSEPVRLPVDASANTALVRVNVTPSTRLMLVEDDAVARAPKGTASKWRDWHDGGTGADVLLVYHELFADAAGELAEDIRSTGRSVATADVESIYEDFSAGELSTNALRAFARHAVRGWKHQPDTLILFGDCTSDGQHVARNNVMNYVPTRVLGARVGSRENEYCSDAFFGWSNGKDEVADLFVGRFSAASPGDAHELVRKTKLYRRLPPQEWAGRTTIVSDPGGFLEMANAVRQSSIPSWIDERLISTQAYPWEDNFYLPPEALEGEEIKVSPAVTREIQDEFERGAAILSFVGHGSPNIWSNQRIWFGGDSENSDNLRLRNSTRLPFITSWTCNNGAIDYPVPRWNITIIEDMLRARNGGAIAAFVPSGPGYERFHKYLAAGIFRAFGTLGVREFGMLSEMSRLNLQVSAGSNDHSQMYLLQGDPTLALPPVQPGLAVLPASAIIGPEATRQEIALKVYARHPLASGPRGDELLTSATITLKSPDGTALATESWTPAAPSESFDAKLEAALPLDQSVFSVFVRAVDTKGSVQQGGATIHRAAADVVIERFEQQPPERDAKSAKATWLLRNRSPYAAQALLRVDRETPDGPQQLAQVPVAIAPFDRLSVPVDLAAPDGAWMVRATVTPSRTQPTKRDTLAASQIDVLIADTPTSTTQSDLVIPPGGYRVVPGDSRSGRPRLEVFVANLGGGNPVARLRWTLMPPDDAEPISGVSVFGRIGPGASSRTQLILPMPLELANSVRLSLAVESDEGGTDLDTRNNGLSIEFKPSLCPDLRVAPNTVTVSPHHLAEGLTVFVEAIVENAGSAPSLPCQAALYASDDQGFASPLRTSPEDYDGNLIPALKPGEQWPIRLRWDPRQNLGVHEIQLLVDSGQTLMESGKSNNRVVVPMDIKSKWNLRGGGIRLGQSPRPGTVVLVATVSNTGETDAQRVSLFFYGDSPQSKENFIGEVLVDRIAAGSEIEVPFEWDVRGLDLKQKRRPSFDLAIKGSLQRISPASD